MPFLWPWSLLDSSWPSCLRRECQMKHLMSLLPVFIVIFPLQKVHHDWVWCGWCTHLLTVHHLRHPTDDGGEAQVRLGPRGVRLRLSQHLPRRHQPVPLHPHDCWRLEVRLENKKSEQNCELRLILVFNVSIVFEDVKLWCFEINVRCLVLILEV